MNLGEKLLKLRKEKGITQKIIATYLGIGTNTYSQYENNKRFPTYEILEKIVRYYNVDYNFVLGTSLNNDEFLDNLIKYFTIFVENKKIINELNRFLGKSLDDPEKGMTEKIKAALDEHYEKHYNYVKILIDILMHEGFRKDIYAFDNLDKKIMTGDNIETRHKKNKI